MKILIIGSSNQLAKIILREFKGEHEFILAGRFNQKIDFELGEEIPKEIISEIEAIFYLAHDYSYIEKDNTEINLYGAKKIFDSAMNNGGIKVYFFSSFSARMSTKSRYGQTKFNIERLADNYPNVVCLKIGFVSDLQYPNKLSLKVAKLVKKIRILPLPRKNKHMYRIFLGKDIKNLIQNILENNLQGSNNVNQSSLLELINLELGNLEIKFQIILIPNVVFVALARFLLLLSKIKILPPRVVDAILTLL